MGVPIGGRTGQLLCGGGIAASRQCQIWPRECCGAVALYCGEKTAVTYKCQKRFLRRLGTYKCESELAGDQKLKKITSESQSQKLARKLSQADAVCWGCSMGVPIPIAGRTGQLLCGGGIAASGQCQIWPRKGCGDVALDIWW